MCSIHVTGGTAVYKVIVAALGCCLTAVADFPRPNNRTGELMTAEEFLCIVGYQSEQGGGKRPKYMGSSGRGGGDSGAGECSE